MDLAIVVLFSAPNTFLDRNTKTTYNELYQNDYHPLAVLSDHNENVLFSFQNLPE